MSLFNFQRQERASERNGSEENKRKAKKKERKWNEWLYYNGGVGCLSVAIKGSRDSRLG